MNFKRKVIIIIKINVVGRVIQYLLKLKIKKKKEKWFKVCALQLAKNRSLVGEGGRRRGTTT